MSLDFHYLNQLKKNHPAWRLLQADDLPQFEEPFKVLLNENTIREIANFQSQLNRKVQDIKERIAQINKSLAEIEYNPVRFIALEIQDIQDIDLPVSTVLIVENDINALILPEIPNTIVLFGRGYGFDCFEKAIWLQKKNIWYWGDIDTHGFAILNQS